MPVAKTYRIRIALPDDTPLHVGMSVEANVVTREKAERAAGAGRCRAGHDGVRHRGQTRAERRQVEVGIRGTRSVEIISGLTEGERVASPAAGDPARRQPRSRRRAQAGRPMNLVLDIA